MSIMVKVEEKLYQNRYIVDESRPHIQIKSVETCQSCEKQACTFCCPAACYSKNEMGGVTLVTTAAWNAAPAASSARTRATSPGTIRAAVTASATSSADRVCLVSSPGTGWPPRSLARGPICIWGVV